MTQIFKNYSEFYNRQDKTINGVSEQFALDHPDYEKENQTNEGCWNCSDCSDCSRCSRCWLLAALAASDCSDCSRCSDCSDLKNNQPESFPEIPVIENIHQKVLEAVSRPNALNMDQWHSCETTHCRAGWVVHLAGAKGYELEKRTSPVFAAMQIYKASSPINVSPPRFYENNAKALEDIKRCAEEETNLNP